MPGNARDIYIAALLGREDKIKHKKNKIKSRIKLLIASAKTLRDNIRRFPKGFPVYFFAGIHRGRLLIILTGRTSVGRLSVGVKLIPVAKCAV